MMLTNISSEHLIGMNGSCLQKRIGYYQLGNYSYHRFDFWSALPCSTLSENGAHNHTKVSGTSVRSHNTEHCGRFTGFFFCIYTAADCSYTRGLSTLKGCSIFPIFLVYQGAGGLDTGVDDRNYWCIVFHSRGIESSSCGRYSEWCWPDHCRPFDSNSRPVGNW
jgi:hypothetical protein